MPDVALPPGHGHIIVCGLDHLGLRTIDELRRRDEDVVAIGPTTDAEEQLAEDARWDVPADEVLDAGEEVVVAATRAGLADLLHLASAPAGTRRSIADVPDRSRGPQLPFDPAQAVTAVLHGVERVIEALPPPIGARRAGQAPNDRTSSR